MSEALKIGEPLREVFVQPETLPIPGTLPPMPAPEPERVEEPVPA